MHSKSPPININQLLARLCVWVMVASVYGIPHIASAVDNSSTKNVNKIDDDIRLSNTDNNSTTSVFNNQITNGNSVGVNNDQSPPSSNNPSTELTVTNNEDVGGVGDAETATTVPESKVRYNPRTGQSLDGSFKFNPLIPSSWWRWEPTVKPPKPVKPKTEDSATALTNEVSHSISPPTATPRDEITTAWNTTTASATTHPTANEAVQSMSLYSPFSIPAVFADIKNNFRYPNNKLTKETTNTLNYMAGGLAFLGMTIITTAQTSRARLHRRRMVLLN